MSNRDCESDSAEKRSIKGDITRDNHSVSIYLREICFCKYSSLYIDLLIAILKIKMKDYVIWMVLDKYGKITLWVIGNSNFLISFFDKISQFI